MILLDKIIKGVFMQKGVIQNEDCVIKVLTEGREFVLVCEDEKDAHSKRVSLYNARRRLSAVDQRKIVIHKERMKDNWVVRVYRGSPNIMEVVNGELVPYEEIATLSETGNKLLSEMLSKGMNEEEVFDILKERGEAEKSIREEIRKLSI
jgi:hypothetical protein